MGPDPAQQQHLARIEPGNAPLGHGAVGHCPLCRRGRGSLGGAAAATSCPHRASPRPGGLRPRGCGAGCGVPGWGQDPYFSPRPWLRLGPRKRGDRSKGGRPSGDTPSPGDTPRAPGAAGRGLTQQLLGQGLAFSPSPERSIQQPAARQLPAAAGVGARQGRGAPKAQHPAVSTRAG